jgi:hypothetical protein
MRPFITFVVLASLVTIPPRAKAQQAAARQSLRAVRADQPIRLDGIFDEPAWRGAQIGTDFIQRYPTPGLRATLRTEVRVAYDADAIYVAARMFDTHPDSIAAPLGRRDPGSISSDWIDVIFDSYNDRRTAYRFGINPAGTKLDVYHFNDDDQDESWDGIWDAATRIDSLGWTAEYRIPLSQLRFHGSKGEQKWGLQFYRAVARRDEWSHWVEYKPSAPGFVSTFGELHGLVGLEPRRPFEVTPYATTQVATGSDALGSPFRKAQRVGGTAGVDFRVGLGSAMSLTGSINPDFGQVEVDPAVINLSAVETFFPEKRPFFLEGSGIFEFDRMPIDAPYGFSRFIHWRRIGRAPQLSPGGDWSRSPDQTTILGAAKVSGQLGGGWSLGIVDAVTEREEAQVAWQEGQRGNVVVEPLTNYFVGRAQRDFDEGRASIGILSTGVNRELDGEQVDFLRGSAWMLGVDGKKSSADRKWTVGGHFIESRVAGSAAAISATQRSSVRYYNRVDAEHLEYDPARTSLSGHDAALGLVYIGSPWFGSAQYAQTSPGYESNDLGYLSRSDLRSLVGAAGRRWNGLSGLVRDGRVMAYGMHAWTYDGIPLYRRIAATGYATIQPLWTFSASAALKPSVMSDHRTRGGPLTRVPRQWEGEAGFSTDERKRVFGGMSVAYEGWAEAGYEGSYSGFLTVRPSSSLQLTLTPRLYRTRNEGQYVRTVSDPLAPTFANRYVFATLRQQTFSVDARSDWTLTPNLTFQLFAQPFTSTARFASYKQLRAGRTFDFDVFGHDVGTATRVGDSQTLIDPDGVGPAQSFVVGDKSNEASFISRALRVNAVLRWEYRGGSAVYLVWQQTRDGDSLLDGDTYDSGLGRILDEPSRNILYLKASYRLGR